MALVPFGQRKLKIVGDEGLFGDSRRHRARIAQLIGL